VLLESRLLGAEGRWETVDGVYHLIANRLHDESPLAASLRTASRDFR
jgi:error-prone DNA polymerase